MTDEKKEKILVIDDEKMNILALAQILKARYELVIALNGANGLEEARKHKPDLILLDILMPEMNGFEVIEQLKADDSTAHIPVIFISGLDNAEDAETGLRLGAADYITKPFHRAIVEKRIAAYLRLAAFERGGGGVMS